MSEKSFDDVAFDKLVAVNSNLIDETKPTARFFELRSAHRNYSLIDALSDAFPAVFVEDTSEFIAVFMKNVLRNIVPDASVEDAPGCNPIYWNVGGHYRDPATMPETVLRWYVLRALRKDTDADPADYINDYEMFASTTALCKKLLEELEYNYEHEHSVVYDPETGKFLEYADPDFGEDAPKVVAVAREQLLSKLRDKGYKFDSYSELYDYTERLDEKSYSPLDEDVLDPEEREFLELDELHDVLNAIYGRRKREYEEEIAEVMDEAMANTIACMRISTPEIEDDEFTL